MCVQPTPSLFGESKKESEEDEEDEEEDFEDFKDEGLALAAAAVPAGDGGVACPLLERPRLFRSFGDIGSPACSSAAFSAFAFASASLASCRNAASAMSSSILARPFFSSSVMAEVS